MPVPSILGVDEFNLQEVVDLAVRMKARSDLAVVTLPASAAYAIELADSVKPGSEVVRFVPRQHETEWREPVGVSYA